MGQPIYIFCHCPISERKIALCRELTKRYEEFLRGTLADAVKWALDH